MPDIIKIIYWAFFGEGLTALKIYYYSFRICQYLKIPMPTINLCLGNEGYIKFKYNTDFSYIEKTVLSLGVDLFFNKKEKYQRIFPYIGKDLKTENAKLLFIIGHELGHYLTAFKYPKLYDKTTKSRLLVYKALENEKRILSDFEYRQLQSEKLADKIGLAIVKIWGYN